MQPSRDPFLPFRLDSLPEMDSVITSEFAKASERTAASPFCLIEQKGLLARLGEELSRAANDLFHDPTGFFRDLVSPADTKDRKRRRLVYVGLGCALVAHSVLLTLMIAAGWHRILEPPKKEGPELVVSIWVPLPKTETPVPDTPKDNAPKGDLQHGGGGGGQPDETPASKGGLLPMLPTPPIVKANAPLTENPTLAITPNIQGPVGPPPPPATPGDPNGNPGQLSAGRGEGEGLGDKTGSGIGRGAGSGVGPGNRAGTKGGDAGTLDGKGTAIGSLYFNVPKPAGYVPFAWIYRPTPVVTPEAQANKSSGTVVVMATFRADGTITDIEIKNQVDYMTESAIDALKRAKFRPASINGVPITLFRVPVRIDIELTRHR